ncbi:MAG: diguanylate cyclase, partial [bacterium]
GQSIMDETNARACVLVEDENVISTLNTILKKLAFSVYQPDNSEELKHQLESKFYVVVFVEDSLVEDLWDLQDWIYEESPSTQICALGDHVDSDTALDWTNRGGFGYYSTPLPTKSIVRKLKSITQLSENQWFLLQTHQTLTEKLREDKEKVQQEANMDGLTGLPNKKHFEQRGKMLIKQARMSESPLTGLVLDVDHFKTYNDNQGHPAGDRVLKTVANLIDNQVRNDDLPGRIGGEEFGVIMPNTDQHGGYKTAERIRKAISGEHISGEDCLPDNRLTVSVGTAEFPTHCESFSELMKVADQATYQSKKQGRNQTTRTTIKQFEFTEPQGEHFNSVSVVGDFNGWRPNQNELKKKSKRTWQSAIPVPEGPLRYGFNLDGERIVADRDAGQTIKGPKGKTVSKIVV